jgi:asparagine synthase (glutamine-hydrolysing)
MSMAHAVEVRPPFLDDRIVAFAARLPERFKFAGFETKFALRRLMRDALPKEVLRRPKVGFDIPIHEWFRGVLRPLLLETLSESTVSQSGLFEWTEVRRIVDEHLDRRANRGYQLWGLVTLMLWMKRWNIEAPARVPLTISAASKAAGDKQVWDRVPFSPRTSEMPLD